MFSKADNYMNEGCFQSASLCGKYPYISDLYLHFFWYCFIFYKIPRLPFWFKILHEATFSGIQLAASFFGERIHSENLYENHL